MTAASVLVVGAGISGIACARALEAAGISARIVERGRVPGGRMASRRLEERPVDLGAAYFTAEDGSPFAEVVADWVEHGLARPWTDGFSVAGPEGLRRGSAGPTRYAAPRGLRSLVGSLAADLGVETEQTVGEMTTDGLVGGVRYDAVVLAMPGPQARRVVPPWLVAAGTPLAQLDGPESWEPVIALALRWPERHWPDDLHGVFVNGSDTLSFVADDGDRRGDGAAVLVAHSTASFARQHLDDPDAAVGPVTAAVSALLDIAEPPSWTHVHRWTFARPSSNHESPFLLDEVAGVAVGVCGDGWGGRTSVGAAWASGDALGRELGRALQIA